MRVLGLIPARGGSKSIPLKNLTPFLGKPLIDHVLDAAFGAGLDVVVSTEHPAIRAHCLKRGADVHDRPQDIADRGEIRETIRDFVKSHACDAIVLLQPTSPFVMPGHIRQVVTELSLSGANSAQTVIECPHAAHEWNQRAIDGGCARFVRTDRPTNKQAKPKRYLFGNVVAFTVAGFIAQNEVFAQPSIPIPIPRLYGFDLDGPEDVPIGEKLSALL